MIKAAAILLYQNREVHSGTLVRFCNNHCELGSYLMHWLHRFSNEMAMFEYLTRFPLWSCLSDKDLGRLPKPFMLESVSTEDTAPLYINDKEPTDIQGQLILPLRYGMGPNWHYILDLYERAYFILPEAPIHLRVSMYRNGSSAGFAEISDEDRENS